MYADYWGLSDSPFRNTLDPRWFYESPVHEEALARLLFLVENRRRCGVLSGRAGTGKSLILEILRAEASRGVSQTSRIDLCGLSPREMLWEIAVEWRLEVDRDDSLRRLWRRLIDHIAANRYAQAPLVLLLDHLDRARPECAGVIERLLHLSAAGDTGLTLILAARTERWGAITASIEEWGDLRVELSSLDHEQSKQYIETLMYKAGATQTVFAPDACERLFIETRGVPRLLNRLCDLSLLAGMAENTETIHESTVLSAANELNLRAISHGSVSTPRQTAQSRS